VLFREVDYFGRAVNIAARIADYAKPGEVVDSARVEPTAFEEIGPSSRDRSVPGISFGLI